MNDDLIGARLGNYEIEQPLGQGGMAHVYKAQDVTLKRQVAIKVIEPSLSAEARYRQRFEREAQSVAALEHPNIVPVYYFGKTENLYYLAMKFIEGEDLAALMNRYAVAGEYLPIDDILHIVEGVAAALDYAHNKNVIHRDVKPSNIMIDREGHPYLTDFGLAFNLTQGTVADILGTPHYLSPEQARNSAKVVPQSDIYSLGVVLYELFTGVVPFDDPSPTAVALQHVTKIPPSPRALNPELSPQLEALILQTIAKEPEDRFQSGKELVEALRHEIENMKQTRSEPDRPALPSLPPGVQLPSRHLSTRPSAAEVRASLAQRESLPFKTPATQIRPVNVPATTTKERRQPKSSPDMKAEKQSPNSLPLLVLGSVIIVVLIVVAVVASHARIRAQSPTYLPVRLL